MRGKSVRVASLAALVLALAVLAGCGTKEEQPPIDTGFTDDEGRDAGGVEADAGGDGLPNVDIESILWDPDTGLQTIHFDFDSYALRPDARQILQRNAEKIKQAPGALVQIEGHCDERGTQEYNLALGEKRALATRDYLMALGISGDRLVTISYGEEVPVAMGHNEAAWAKNRRCEFNKAR